jgi:hypothetical protein
VGSNNSNNSHCDAIFISTQFLEPKLIWHIYMGLVGGVGGWVGWGGWGGWGGGVGLTCTPVTSCASPGQHGRAF